MEALIISLILLCLLIYVFFLWLWIRSAYSRRPSDGICHTEFDLKFNWISNRVMILYEKPFLSSLVLARDMFYICASFLGGVLIYLETKSIVFAFLAVGVFLEIVKKGIMKIMFKSMRPGLQKWWDDQSL